VALSGSAANAETSALGQAISIDVTMLTGTDQS
jgi:hypothetical protein